MFRPARSSARASLLLVLAVAADAGCLKVPAGDLDNPAAASDAPQSAQAVLDRYVAALGGEEALRKIAQRTVEARMTFRPEEGCTPEDEDCRTEEKVGTFTLQTTAEQRMFRRTVIDGQVEQEGYDGKTGWQVRRGYLILEDPEESVTTREDATLHWYFDLAARGLELSLEKPREKDFDGNARVLDGLLWKMKDDAAPPKTLWFDRATGLLSEEILEDRSAEPPISQHVLYDDYRKVDGVLVPHTIRLVNKVGPRTQEVVFTTQRVTHEPVPADNFKIPDIAPPPPMKDERLELLDKARDAAKAAPKDRDAQVAHARAAWGAAHFEEAADAAEAAIKLDKGEAEALWILARARVLQGRFKEAGPLLDRAEKAGVREELVWAQRAWIASQRREFGAVADALDHLGTANAPLASRYRTFAGKPLQVSFGGDGCTTELPLGREGSLGIVEVEIAGEKLPALLDTSASDVILDGDVATRLKVPVRSRSPLGQSGEVGHGQIDALSLGGAKISAVPVDVFPTQTLAQMTGGVGNPPKVVVGVRVLSQLQVTVDAPARKVTLVNPAPKCKSALAARRSGASVPFWLHETHFLYALAKMNGTEGLYLVNSGMQGVGVTASTKAFARAGVAAPPLRRNEAPIVTVARLALGDAHKAENVQAAYGYFEQEESRDQFRLDGMFGLDFVGTARWTIDFVDRKFYFAPSAAPAAPAKGQAPAAAPAKAPAPAAPAK